MNLKRLLGMAVVFGIACTSVLAQTPDPLVGTWKLNPAKSKGTYKSGMSVFEAAGDGVKATVDLVGADGTAYHWSVTAKYDGKDNPITGNNLYGDTIALTRVNPNTVTMAIKQGGKPTVSQTIVIAPDGKTRTTTAKGVDPKGKPVDGMSFYERQ